MKTIKSFILALVLTVASIEAYAQTAYEYVDKIPKQECSFKNDSIIVHKLPAGKRTFQIVSCQYLLRRSGKYPDMWIFEVAHPTIYSIGIYKNDQRQWIIQLNKKEEEIPQRPKK